MLSYVIESKEEGRGGHSNGRVGQSLGRVIEGALGKSLGWAEGLTCVVLCTQALLGKFRKKEDLLPVTFCPHSTCCNWQK